MGLGIWGPTFYYSYDYVRIGIFMVRMAGAICYHLGCSFNWIRE